MSTRFTPWIASTAVRIDATYAPPGTARVALDGEVDLATAPEVRTALLAILGDQRTATLVVDLERVMFLDCAGLGALVGVRNAAVESGRTIRVTNPRPIVRRVLDVTGLSIVFASPTT
jgi:anti-anti-sigma factor